MAKGDQEQAARDTDTEIARLKNRADTLEHMLLVLLTHIVVRDSPEQGAVAKSFLNNLDLSFATSDEGRRLRFNLLKEVKELIEEA